MFRKNIGGSLCLLSLSNYKTLTTLINKSVQNSIVRPKKYSAHIHVVN